MNKFLALLLIAMICITPTSFAKYESDQNNVNPVVVYRTDGSGTFTTSTLGVGLLGTAVASTTLDADPTTVTGGTIDARDIDRISFMASYDETEVGATVGGTLTLEASIDGTTWVTTSFYDLASPTTLVASEVWTVDAPAYYFWVSKEMLAPYYRVKFVATGTDADDVAVVACKYAARR